MPFDHARSTFRGRAATLVGVLTALVVLTGCLGPDEFDPTGRSPIGRLDVVVADGASIRVIGWALDPDTRSPIDVMVSVEAKAVAHRASLSRPDVGAVHPAHGAAHGFDVRTPPLPPGRNDVCVWAVNVLQGTRDRSLGCRTVVTGSDSVIGSFDAVRQSGPSRIRIEGWAYDPDAPGSSTVTATIDGVAHRVDANQFRDGLRTIFRKSGNHAFSADLPARVGSRRVCITANNVGRGSNASLGCRDVTVNDLPGPLDGADVRATRLVGPPAGHPLRGIERDAGVSTVLRDGTTFWLFGDSVEWLPGGGFRYFVNNTAALSTRTDPAVTRDGVRPGNVPAPFVTPSAEFSTPCPSGFNSVMWPLSVTAVPHGSSASDRVIAFFGNVCLRGMEPMSRGVAVVEWIYDPATMAGSSSVGPIIAGRVLEQNLFPVGAEYGTASQIVDGLLYAYECGRPADGGSAINWPDDPAYSGCTVARVDPARVADRTAWSYWNGGADHTSAASWSALPADAATMQIPGIPGDKQMPVSSFSLTRDPHHGQVMVYSPWPGYTDNVVVRSAASPVGPWSAVRHVALPGCNEWGDGVGRFCYAGTAQPHRSTPTTLGLGWFDQMVAVDPVRGSYLSATTPWAPPG